MSTQRNPAASSPGGDDMLVFFLLYYIPGIILKSDEIMASNNAPTKGSLKRLMFTEKTAADNIIWCLSNFSLSVKHDLFKYSD
jgi:hypothetical protein